MVIERGQLTVSNGLVSLDTAMQAAYMGEKGSPAAVAGTEAGSVKAPATP